jgi:hypothetical protein
MVSKREFYQTFKWDMSPISENILQKKIEEKGTCLISFYESKITVIPNQTKVIQNQQSKNLVCIYSDFP